MNWITKNNYSIKRKFNQRNNINNKLKRAGNNLANNRNIVINQNQINYNINDFNQGNNNNVYTNIYYQINGNECLQEQMEKGENLIKKNLDINYILSELNEF